MNAHVRPPCAPPPLVVALPGAVAEKVRRLALRRGDNATSMVVAMVDHMLANGAAGELLAELDLHAPRKRPGHGIRLYGGVMLTQSQAAVVYLIGQNRDADGICRLSSDSLAYLTGLPIGTVQSILTALVKWHIIRCFGRAKRGQARAWELSAKGVVALFDLAGVE